MRLAACRNIVLLRCLPLSNPIKPVLFLPLSNSHDKPISSSNALVFWSSSRVPIYYSHVSSILVFDLSSSSIYLHLQSILVFNHSLILLVTFDSNHSVILIAFAGPHQSPSFPLDSNMYCSDRDLSLSDACHSRSSIPELLVFDGAISSRAGDVWF